MAHRAVEPESRQSFDVRQRDQEPFAGYSVIDLVFGSPQFDNLRTALQSFSTEAAAILLCREVTTNLGSRLLVRQIHVMSDPQLSYRTSVGIEIKPEVVAQFSKEARTNDLSLTFVHTHPNDSHREFSPIDDAGEGRLKVFLDNRNSGHAHVSVLLTPDAVAARVIGGDGDVRVMQIGRKVDTYGQGIQVPKIHPDTFDRQVRVFGTDAQARLAAVKVGIVGVGGIGSVIAEELTHLGVADLTLVDPDVIESTNLNRVVGAKLNDIGEYKVDVAARWITALRPDHRVRCIRGSVLATSVAHELRNIEFLFICTDSNGSRAILNQFAYQYLIPSIDTGVAIAVKKSRVTSVTGRVQMLAPGLGCLTCAELLDPDAVRTDLMTDYERQTDPYFIGTGTAQPAVMSINATVASLAVTMFLGAVAHIPADARFQLYDGIRGTLRHIRHDPVAACVVCSQRGALARGDEWPLPTRNM